MTPGSGDFIYHIPNMDNTYNIQNREYENSEYEHMSIFEAQKLIPKKIEIPEKPQPSALASKLLDW